MKSSRRRLVILVLVLCLFAGLIAINQTRSEKEARGSVSSSDATPVGVTHENVDRQAEIEGRQADRQLRAVAMLATPIDFYGKVVDEHGSPVAGALVRYRIDGVAANDAGEPGLSDESGSFSITGESGPAINVWVEHPNYYKTSSADQHFQYAEAMQFENQPALPSLENLAVFKLKRKGSPEPLTYFRNKEIDLGLEGKATLIKLVDSSPDRDEDNSVFVSLRSGAKTVSVNGYHPYPWHLEISSPGGGLVERRAPRDFTAPDRGYTETLEIDMPDKLQENWTSQFEDDFFVQLKSGHYARISLRVSAGSGFTVYESFYNPKKGSRNLEPSTNISAE